MKRIEEIRILISMFRSIWMSEAILENLVELNRFGRN